MTARHSQHSTSGWPSTLFVGDTLPSPYRREPPSHWAARFGLRVFLVVGLAVLLGFSAGVGWAVGKAFVWVLDRVAAEILYLLGVFL